MHPSTRARQLVLALLAELCVATVRGQNFTFEGGGITAGGGGVRGDRFEALVTFGEAWTGSSSREHQRTELGIGIVEPRLDLGPGPLLTVARGGDRLTLRWEVGEARFALQETSDPVRGPWIGVDAVPESVDGRWRVEVPILGARYYRLVALPPWLTAEATATSVRLTWDSFDPSFVVQESRSGFEETDWIDRATAVRPVAGRWIVELPAEAGWNAAFFRLRRR